MSGELSTTEEIQTLVSAVSVLPSAGFAPCQESWRGPGMQWVRMVCVASGCSSAMGAFTSGPCRGTVLVTPDDVCLSKKTVTVSIFSYFSSALGILANVYSD